jgi:hypothetical protein
MLNKPPYSPDPPRHDQITSQGKLVIERNRYFKGKFIAARDLKLEQEYFLSHHRLHNRLMHGWGVVCGLKVEPHPDEKCRGEWVVVTPGIALDCHGRELILEKPVYVHVARTTPSPSEPQPSTNQQSTDDKPGRMDARQESYETPKSKNGSDPKYQPEKPEEPLEKYLVCLSYHEILVEHVAVLFDEDCCDPNREEANRIREAVCIEVKLADQDELNRCWPTSGDNSNNKDCLPCQDEKSNAGCLEPNCACDCVPLALLRLKPHDRAITSEHIDTRNRPQIFTPSTQITQINWRHGGTLTLEELRQRNGQLRVHFNRKLKPNDGERTGINEHTFVVQYGGVQGALEFMPSEEYSPELEENGCSAVFTIDSSRLGGKKSIAENTVYVTLKCNYILDCDGNPVDGDYLGARLPTGDGRPGGTFESWFRVVVDREEEE